MWENECGRESVSVGERVCVGENGRKSVGEGECVGESVGEGKWGWGAGKWGGRESFLSERECVGE